MKRTNILASILALMIVLPSLTSCNPASIGDGIEEKSVNTKANDTIYSTSLLSSTENSSDTMEHISTDGAIRPEKTSLGAIRWDAWTSHDGNPNSVISQVERALSPAEFHERAPFFAEVTEDGNIIIPEYTQEIFDLEMEYAIYAGIDYFAYVWYNSAMKAAREFHTQSKYKNDVKMCACFDGNAIGKDYARQDMEKLFMEDYYMKVLDGRPLMYYFAVSSNLAKITEDIRYYRELTKKLGIPEPYAVIMNVSAEEAYNAYGDAVSSYTVYGHENETFSALMKRAHSQWKKWNATGLSHVPTVSFGWNPKPRYINPVSWVGYEYNSWSKIPAAKEIQKHLMYALSYMDHPCVTEQTEANILLSYAWNEHDEGGWLCPTIAVDKNGNQIYNDDGSKKLNTERIEAVKSTLASFEGGERTTIVINGVSNAVTEESTSATEALTESATETVTETEAASNNESLTSSEITESGTADDATTNGTEETESNTSGCHSTVSTLSVSTVCVLAALYVLHKKRKEVASR